MDYMKPEIIELDAKMAGGAPCNLGWFNYTAGCTEGFANSTACGRGIMYGASAGCQFGMGAQVTCFYGWGVQ